MDNPAYLTVLQNADFLDMESTVTDVQKFMSRTNHTLVPVFDVGKAVFGVVSAIDVIDFLASEGNPRTTKAWEICSHKLLKADINTSPIELARLFLDNKVHHVLLTDAGQVTAIVSSMDLCRYLLEKSGQLS